MERSPSLGSHKDDFSGSRTPREPQTPDQPRIWMSSAVLTRMHSDEPSVYFDAPAPREDRWSLGNIESALWRQYRRSGTDADDENSKEEYETPPRDEQHMSVISLCELPEAFRLVGLHEGRSVDEPRTPGGEDLPSRIPVARRTILSRRRPKSMIEQGSLDLSREVQRSSSAGLVLNGGGRHPGERWGGILQVPVVVQVMPTIGLDETPNQSSAGPDTLRTESRIPRPRVRHRACDRQRAAPLGHSASAPSMPGGRPLGDPLPPPGNPPPNHCVPAR